MTVNNDTAIEEILDRSRRIESRLTSFIAKSGFSTGGKRPEWDRIDETIVVPSREIALIEVINAIPSRITKDVPVIFAGRTICTINVNNI